jgi:hypothetical protein
MSDNENETKEFINRLELYGITYIYNPEEEINYSDRSWINVNTNHMRYLFNKYNTDLKGCNYSIIIEINEETKYISRDYNSIINYFIENKEEYTNNIFKKVHLKYIIDA